MYILPIYYFIFLISTNLKQLISDSKFLYTYLQEYMLIEYFLFSLEKKTS